MHHILYINLFFIVDVRGFVQFVVILYILGISPKSRLINAQAAKRCNEFCCYVLVNQLCIIIKFAFSLYDISVIQIPVTCIIYN